MDKRRARLVRKRQLSSETLDFRFELQDGRLADAEPGAHVDIHLPNDLLRQYSLWDWDEQGRWFNVAVKLEADGRGGSKAMHALQEGSSVGISGPRNNFQLQPGDNHKTLIAGGIGATPIYAMANQLARARADFRVHYVVRSRAYAAFDAAFRSLAPSLCYRLHCTNEESPFDLPAVLRSVPPGGDVYACGPERMLNAVQDGRSLLRGGKVHLERFVARERDFAPKEAFEIEVQSSGAVYKVARDQTILQVLRDQGVQVDCGCTEGLCGSCIVDVVSGEVDHRDSVLSPEEQASHEFLCVCVSRALSSRLVLGL